MAAPAIISALLGAALLLAGGLSARAEISPADLEFFETQVRPVLVERCYECHSREKKSKGGLLLDSRQGWERGGDSGPALVPGAPESSLLVKALRHDDPDLAMPPKRKLEQSEISLLTEWVRRGAPDPREAAAPAAKRRAMTLEESRSYWAFQAPRESEPPAVQTEGWVRNEIDRFVLVGLEKEGLKLAPRADARALLRRVYFDLIGLPPTYEQVQKFAADPSPEALAREVEALLARPEYGQRWGRHWLDVARYSDTTEKSTDGERRIPFAHTYRDYVVDALNADMPFSRFIVEQIAADRLPASEHADLRALGFLTVGRRFEGNAEAPQLIIDDRIDVIGRGFLGLTLACARCHDHKFDPIPSADYYSLYGILGSSEEPLDLPETSAGPETEAVQKYRAERAKLFAEYAEHTDKSREKAARLLRELAPEYLQYLVEISPNHRTVEGFFPLDTPRGLLVRGGPVRWQQFIDDSLRAGQPFFRLWAQLIALPSAGFEAAAQRLLAEAPDQAEEYDPGVLAAFQATPPKTMRVAAEMYGQLLTEALATPGQFGPLLDASPLNPTEAEVAVDLRRFVTEHQLVSRPDGEAADKIRERLTQLEAAAPVERALVLQPSVQLLDAHILPRGDRHQPGAAVPRRFLQALATVDDRSYSDDGRLELAQAIASDRNPLTARVIVNRVWQHHFGQGLVATPDNFGTMGEKPSNPALLDHLATWFMAHGWSLKALHRYILDSAAWQQSGPPRRLEFEPLRDALLQVSGQLDLQTGGRSAPLSGSNFRRALYGFTDRFRVPALLRSFDVANPDTSISRRSETIHPLQALYFLNSPFIRARAEAVVQHTAPADRITTLYRRVLSRDPTESERALAADYLGPEPTDRLWASYAQVLLLSNEFAFCD